MLQNEYLLAKIGADPAENELQKDPKTRHLKDVNGDITARHVRSTVQIET